MVIAMLKLCLLLTCKEKYGVEGKCIVAIRQSTYPKSARYYAPKKHYIINKNNASRNIELSGLHVGEISTSQNC